MVASLPSRVDRYVIPVLQAVVALPWLLLDHPVHGGPAMVVWLALGLILTRQPKRLPSAIARRRPPKLLPCG